MNPDFPPAVIGLAPRPILRSLVRTHFHQPAICLFRALELMEMRDLEFAAPILDLGCGNGDIGDLALRSHWPAIGLDLLPSEVRAAVARDAYAGATVGDGTTLPFPDSSFATVVSICVLEHIPDDLGVVAGVARVLQPGGRFIFTTPSEHFESELLDAGDPAAVAAVTDRLGHFHYRSRDDWYAILRAHDLQPVEHRFFLPPSTQRRWQRLDNFMVKRLGSRRTLDIIRGLHRRKLLPLGLWSWLWSVVLTNSLRRVSTGAVGGGQLIVARKAGAENSSAPHD